METLWPAKGDGMASWEREAGESLRTGRTAAAAVVLGHAGLEKVLVIGGFDGRRAGFPGFRGGLNLPLS